MLELRWLNLENKEKKKLWLDNIKTDLQETMCLDVAHCHGWHHGIWNEASPFLNVWNFFISLATRILLEAVNVMGKTWTFCHDCPCWHCIPLSSVSSSLRLDVTHSLQIWTDLLTTFSPVGHFQILASRPTVVKSAQGEFLYPCSPEQ